MSPNTATRAAANGRTMPIETTQPRSTSPIRVGKSPNVIATAEA